MSRVAIVLALMAGTGCNQLFDLDQTAIDPGDPGMMVDARRAMCPTQPGVLPAFGATYTRVGTRYCSSYSDSPDTGRAVAVCLEAGLGGNQIGDGPIDGDFTPIPELAGLYQPRLSPEGDELFVRQDSPLAFFVYRNVGGVWTQTSALAVGAMTFVSTPSRQVAGTRHVLAVQIGSDTLHELVDAGGGWVERSSISGFALGATPLGEPSLSADGLRMLAMVFNPADGEYRLYFGSRASIDDPFTGLARIDSIRNPQSAGYMTADCGRLYFNDPVNGVFYAQQE